MNIFEKGLVTPPSLLSEYDPLSHVIRDPLGCCPPRDNNLVVTVVKSWNSFLFYWVTLVDRPDLSYIIPNRVSNTCFVCDTAI